MTHSIFLSFPIQSFSFLSFTFSPHIISRTPLLSYISRRANRIGSVPIPSSSTLPSLPPHKVCSQLIIIMMVCTCIYAYTHTRRVNTTHTHTHTQTTDYFVYIYIYIVPQNVKNANSANQARPTSVARSATPRAEASCQTAPPGSGAKGKTCSTLWAPRPFPSTR